MLLNKDNSPAAVTEAIAVDINKQNARMTAALTLIANNTARELCKKSVLPVRFVDPRRRKPTMIDLATVEISDQLFDHNIQRLVVNEAVQRINDYAISNIVTFSDYRPIPKAKFDPAILETDLSIIAAAQNLLPSIKFAIERTQDAIYNAIGGSVTSPDINSEYYEYARKKVDLIIVSPMILMCLYMLNDCTISQHRIDSETTRSQLNIHDEDGNITNTLNIHVNPYIDYQLIVGTGNYEEFARVEVAKLFSGLTTANIIQGQIRHVINLIGRQDQRKQLFVTIINEKKSEEDDSN